MLKVGRLYKISRNFYCRANGYHGELRKISEGKIVLILEMNFVSNRPYEVQIKFLCKNEVFYSNSSINFLNSFFEKL